MSKKVCTVRAAEIYFRRCTVRHDGHSGVEDDSIRHRQLRQLPPLLVLGELHGELSVGITSSIYSVRLQ